MSGGQKVPKNSDEAEVGDPEVNDDEPEEPAVPQRSITKVKALYGKQDSEVRYQSETEEPVDAAENKETARYAFLVRKLISYDSRKRYEMHPIIVQSPWLKKALGVILEGYPQYHHEPRPPQRIRRGMSSENTSSSFTMSCLRSSRTPSQAKTDLVKNGGITFEYLWTIFEPQTLVYSVAAGKECVFKLDTFQKPSRTNEESSISSNSVSEPRVPRDDFDQLVPRRYSWNSILKMNSSWRVSSSAANCSKAAPATITRYTESGSGIWPLRHDPAQHRVMDHHLDCEAHNRFLPVSAVYFSPLFPKTTKPPKVVPESDDKAEAIDNYKHASKKWLWFFVEKVEEIEFAKNAFGSKEQKSLIRSFVESGVKYKDDFDDVIAGKGRGMIMLLSSPPGVAKTLTGGSVAEDMRVPVYVMSAEDLGTDPSSIEVSLNLVMDMARRWNAILLWTKPMCFGKGAR
ncbi:hypothetical protein G647_08552 [Cladophialophora carrionii CBS 160.54]|uniref:DUF7025 domain-containing protein n=1 Tax=Cladophialophora carrionii CBS 160.54 TaxID=1279043 RepID=V9D0V2_9EURO|nr:uncharacterized protein G647_08552 [Cladophialophora carrionii CBS 160.54]ETI20515.1 hypothetical protein G647_08552 [Cladophialophora carrionii CBS 160.54]